MRTDRYASTAYTDPYMGFGGKWGYYTDAELGTQLLGHRFYDSGAGRFVNRDPIGYSGGVNQYGYTSNSPVNRADPSGFQWYGPVPPPPTLREFTTFVGHCWNAPNSMIGAIFSTGGSWTYDSKHEVWRVKGGWLADFNYNHGYGGITIGDVVMSDVDLQGTLLEHECTHATQGRLFGPAYLPLTLAGYNWGIILDPFQPHDGSPLEIWADYGGGRIDKNQSGPGKLVNYILN